MNRIPGESPEGGAAERLTRMHARLDDELTPPEEAELEQELARDPAAADRAAALAGLARLARESRVAAPAGFTDRVMQSITSEPGARAERGAVPAGPVAETPRAIRLRPAGLGGRLAAFFFGGSPIPGLRALGAAGLAALVFLAAFLLVRFREHPGGRLPGAAPQVAERTTAPDAGQADLVVHRFVLEARDARTVCLVGDFNQWKLCEVPMKEDEAGHWTVDLTLPRGRHQYMFVIDDRQWQTDPRADVKVDDGFGNQNAVVFL